MAIGPRQPARRETFSRSPAVASVFAAGFAAFVNGLAAQWGAGGTITAMIVGYYFIGLLLMSIGCMKCCSACGVCGQAKK